MFLCEYKLNGSLVSTLQEYSVSDLNGNEPYIISDTVPANYEDISSIKNWSCHGYFLDKDYKLVRSHIISLVQATGFSNLTAEEKDIACRDFCVSKADRDTVHTMEQQIANGIEFHRRSIRARLDRKIAAEGEVYNRMSIASERSELIGEVTNMTKDYIDFGVEGTLEGDAEGLFDYLESRVGTSFENTGFLSKTYTVEGMTVAQLSARLIDILKNGNY